MYNKDIVNVSASVNLMQMDHQIYFASFFLKKKLMRIKNKDKKYIRINKKQRIVNKKYVN